MIGGNGPGNGASSGPGNGTGTSVAPPPGGVTTLNRRENNVEQQEMNDITVRVINDSAPTHRNDQIEVAMASPEDENLDLPVNNQIQQQVTTALVNNSEENNEEVPQVKISNL